MNSKPATGSSLNKDPDCSCSCEAREVSCAHLRAVDGHARALMPIRTRFSLMLSTVMAGCAKWCKRREESFAAGSIAPASTSSMSATEMRKSSGCWPLGGGSNRRTRSSASPQSCCCMRMLLGRMHRGAHWRMSRACRQRTPFHGLTPGRLKVDVRGARVPGSHGCKESLS